MEETDALTGAAGCPQCGSTLSKLPKVDGEGYIFLCSACGQEVTPSVRLDSRSDDQGSPSRFRKLLQEVEEADTSDLPPSLLEDLPEDARSLLTAKQLDRPTQRSKTGELREEMAQELRLQGYAIEEDAHGVRISGGLPGRGSAAGMSPYDVVRMAADLDGGLPPASELQRCSKCEAVIPPGDKRCQWCGTPTENAETESK